MPVPRPKILTAVTVPTGGWDLQFQVSESGQYDHTLTATVPAGAYYIAWDAQSDDLLYQLSAAMTTAITDAGMATSEHGVVLSIDTDNKVKFSFDGSLYVDGTYENDVKLQWTASDADLATALGFDSSADDESTSTDNPTFTGDYQHGYGWYADTDGQLEDLLVEDSNMAVTPQAVSISGRVTSQNIGERFTNELSLGWMTRAQTFSRGIGYGAASSHPYARNVPLECWWRAAMLGTEFRVYREGRNSIDVFVEYGVATSASTSQVNNTNKAWTTEPQQFADMSCISTGTGGEYVRFHIASNTATALVAANTSPSGYSWAWPTAPFWVLDHRYQTYVVDLTKMKEYAPREATGIDYYGITIPLLRYES